MHCACANANASLKLGCICVQWHTFVQIVGLLEKKISNGVRCTQVCRGAQVVFGRARTVLTAAHGDPKTR